MFNHGTITAMLFLLVGVLYDQAHHRDIDGFGGLMVDAGVRRSDSRSSRRSGPGLSGFISEALVPWAGSARSGAHGPLRDGIVLGAAYMLWTFQRVFLGPLNEKYKDLAEISPPIFTLAPLGAIVLLGFYPVPVLGLFEASMTHLVKVVWG